MFNAAGGTVTFRAPNNRSEHCQPAHSTAIRRNGGDGGDGGQAGIRSRRHRWHRRHLAARRARRDRHRWGRREGRRRRQRERAVGWPTPGPPSFTGITVDFRIEPGSPAASPVAGATAVLGAWRVVGERESPGGDGFTGSGGRGGNGGAGGNGLGGGIFNFSSGTLTLAPRLGARSGLTAIAGHEHHHRQPGEPRTGRPGRGWQAAPSVAWGASRGHERVKPSRAARHPRSNGAGNGGGLDLHTRRPGDHRRHEHHRQSRHDPRITTFSGPSRSDRHGGAGGRDARRPSRRSPRSRRSWLTRASCRSSPRARARPCQPVAAGPRRARNQERPPAPATRPGRRTAWDRDGRPEFTMTCSRASQAGRTRRLGRD